MRLFSEKHSTPQSVKSAGTSVVNRAHTGQGSVRDSIPYTARTVGNEPGLRELQTDTPEHDRGRMHSAPSHFQPDLSRVPVTIPDAAAIQTKLAVSSPGDENEREADRIAELVMRTADPKLPSTPVSSGVRLAGRDTTAAPVRQRLQAKSADASATRERKPSSLVQQALRAPGQPLDTGTRAFMEPRFAYDFSGVRIHTDSLSARSARGMNARAFTVGRDIVFGEGQYSPHTPWGKLLIAHELTHVVQQQRGANPMVYRTIQSLSEEERQRITVITSSVSIQGLDSLFSTEMATTTIDLPDVVTATFVGTIPTALERGLRNVAGLLIPGTLTLNSTITLALDLSAYGGDSSLYQFTYVERASAEGTPTREVFIEHLGAAGTAGLTEPQREAQQQRFEQHNFSRGSGWSDEEFQALLGAIAQIPDGMLTPVDGLTFDRAAAHPTEPEAGGDYDPDSHAITLYDLAFTSSPTRFGAQGENSVSTNAVRSVVHEIGHAIDLLPLRQAWSTLDQTQEAFRLAFQQYESPPGSGSYSFPSNMQARFDTLLSQITDAEQALTDARAASGHRWELQQDGKWEIVEGGTDAGNSAFRQAAEQDGNVRVTEYSSTEWQEYFAESYSLYITNPDLLEQLRPNVYAYFAATYPR